MRRPAVLFSLMAALAGCGGEQPARLNVGDAAPAFSAERNGGGMLKFPADLAGKPVVIRFWADWCRYCEAEMKAIENVYHRRRGDGLEVIAVNAGQDRDTVKSFIARLGVTYPALIDEKSAIARQYGVVGLPTTFFVDRRGVVRAKLLGEADEATFDRHAAELLK